MNRGFGYWLSDNMSLIIIGLVIVAIVVGGLIASFQPYCTTFSDGATLCSQIEWGGKRFWYK